MYDSPRHERFTEQLLSDVELDQIESDLKKNITLLIEKAGLARGRQMFDGLVDDLCTSLYGVAPIESMRKVRSKAFDKSTTIQTLNKGKAVLISPYGYTVTNETTVGGKTTLTLTELTLADRQDGLE